MSVRQQALATAQVYIKRFYIKVEIRRTNPYLILATALYLACKMEECPQHIRVFVSEARQMWPGQLSASFSSVFLSLMHALARLYHLRRLEIRRVRILADFGDEFSTHRSPPISHIAAPARSLKYGAR